MQKANLPVEKATEPDEDAHQPQLPKENMTPKLTGRAAKKVITFTDDTDTETPSQKSSTYKEVLSQPAANISHRDRLVWLQKRRTGGLWAQCDDCARWRYLPHVVDSYELPQKWYCRLNPGSVVWARMLGWPWWPAMVDDCPDTERYYWLDGFSDIPTHYNVVFFDSDDVTRAWITPENIKPYATNKNIYKPFLKLKKYKLRLEAAVKQADDAVKLPLTQRLEKYSFLATYKGPINSPKKITKKELEKHQKRLKRKFNIQFEESESDNDGVQPKSVVKNKNIITLGTRKNPKKRTLSTFIERDEVHTATQEANAIEEINEIFEPNVKKEEPKVVKTKTIENDPNTEASTDTCKKDNSLTVQVGSTANSATAEETFENDTSTTYVPEKESQESTQNSSAAPRREFDLVIASPSSAHSGDFDY